MGDQLLDSLESLDFDNLCHQAICRQFCDAREGNQERTVLFECLVLLNVSVKSLFDPLYLSLEILPMRLDLYIPL